ncbi:MAG: pseudaminic acid synthase, partial [Planctomycetes bacterium]|nr:pseudaminic acid synthase [Planctomycetota bacterium]
EQSLGKIQYGPGSSEQGSVAFRRSLFAIKDINKGEVFSQDNIRAIRPGNGIHPKHLKALIGQSSQRHILRGNPLLEEDIPNVF